MATGEQGAAAAMSHTGSLAGSHASYRAVFQHAGAIMVDDFEALMETTAFYAKAPPPRGRGVAVVAASGGAAIIATDRVEQRGVAMPQPAPEVKAILESRVPEFGPTRNPCDVTAQILADPESLGICARALLGDPQYGVLVSPLTYGYAPSAQRPQTHCALAEPHGKMACVVGQTEWQDGPGVVEAHQCDRVALFRSMNSCSRRWPLGIWRADKKATGAQLVPSTPPEVIARTRGLITAACGRTLTQRQAKDVLAYYSVPVVGERLAASTDEAVSAGLSGGDQGRIPGSAAQDRGRRDPPQSARR